MSKRPLPRRPAAVAPRRRAVGAPPTDSPRRRPRGGLLARIIPAGVLAAAIAVVLVIAFGQVGGATSSARTEREVVPAADGVVQSTVTGTGNLEPVTEEDVGFQTAGTLRAVDVKEGDYVKKGQLLATLDSATAALTLKQARATLAEAHTTLTDDRKTLAGEDDDSSTSDDTSANVADSGAVTEDVADPVSTATTAATPTTTAATPTTTAAPPTTAAAPATTATTATTLTTTVTAPATTVTTTTTAPTLATGRGQSTTTAQSTTSDGGSTRSSSGSSGNTGSASSDVTAATIDSDKLAIVNDEQTVKEDATDVSETRLTAPVSGTITSLESIVPGDSISSGSDSNADAAGASSSASQATAGTSSTGATTASGGSSSTSSSSSAFAEIDTLRHLSMSVSFTEADISELKVGEPATITLDALTDTELAGKVTAVSSLGSTDDDVVSYDATITLDQYDAQVKPGMSASAAVIIKQAHGVTVPSGAVTGTATLASVTEDVNGKDTTKQVIVGLRGSSRDLIVSGLKSGTELVETETLPSTGSSAEGTTTSASGAGGFAGGGGFARGGGGGGGFGGGAAGGFGGGAAGGGGGAR